MTQGELEKLPAGIERAMNQLQVRIMDDIVRRIRINRFSTASADWQFTRLQQLGMSQKEIKEWVRIALEVSEEEIEKIYSDTTYEEYMKQGRGYDVYGRQQIPFEENQELQQLIEGIKKQTNEELRNITGTLGFVRKGVTGGTEPITLTEFYVRTLDDAMYDIHSGAFDYSTVVQRTIEDMTASGIRWIDYDSGHHNRVPVAARRAVMTGFRQVQGKINEQTARDLGTDYYEVTVHIGARPTHQPWEGKVWTMEQLKTVCGLGTVTGLHGANCYHDYNAFIPGVSVRAYTDEQLEQIHEKENTTRIYNGKEYTTYEALQRQRQLETRARKYREDAYFLEKSKEGLSSEEAADIDEQITLKKARYQGILQEYIAFSDKMDLPTQRERIYQDGLKVDMKQRNVQKRVDSEETLSFEGGDERGAAHSVNTGERVHYNPVSDYRIELDSLPEPIKEKVAELNKQLAKLGDESGHEYAAIVDIDTGEICEPYTDGEPGNVRVNYDFLKDRHNCIFLHNHNTDTELSFPDVCLIANDEPINIVAAVRNDGIITVVESNGRKSREYLYLTYSDTEEWKKFIKEMNASGKNTEIARELFMRDLAIRDFSKGGMITYGSK